MTRGSLLSRIRAALSAARAPRLDASCGFTLLEVIIAMTIMVLAFAAILSVESNSISATTRAKEINIVTMLLRDKMVELEYQIEGKTFDEIKKEETGTFDAPYETFHWKTEVKEIKFPNMNFGGGKGTNASGDDNGGQYAELLTKLLTKFFSKAVREISRDSDLEARPERRQLFGLHFLGGSQPGVRNQ